MPPKSKFHEGGDAFLQSLFTCFSYFSFDKAKEQADRERDISKSFASSAWITLLTCISQLATVEKLYMNLTFLTPKGFLRKETSVRLTYETILTELVEIEKRRASSGTSYSCSFSSASTAGGGAEKSERACSEGLLLHISNHLVLFIQARLLMLSFYEKLITCSANKHVDYDEMHRYIDEIINKNSSAFHHPVLAPIKTTFTYESEITSHLLGALKAMRDWQFLAALLHLHDAHTKLLSWQALIQCKESKKYTFGSSFLKVSAAAPALYQWLWSAKASFVSKFSLYFHEVLSCQAPASDTKSLLAKLSCDYVGKIQNFQKKMDAHSVCIVLDGTGLPDLKPAGYCHPSEQGVHPEGLDSFPALFSCPQKPGYHWPNIVMQISGRTTEEEYDKVVNFHDEKARTTLFFCQIEPRLFLVVVFENRRPEKEAFVNDFLLDISEQLRCNKVFAALKPN